MADPLQNRILSYLKSDRYRPQDPDALAQELHLEAETEYHAFRGALRDLMHAGRVVLGAGGTIVLPSQSTARDEFVGTYRHNRRGFGFVVPTDPAAHEDLFIPPGEKGGALGGDIVRAKITNREQRDGKMMYRGRVVEIIQRTQNRFVGSLAKLHGQWVVLPDGNTLPEPILAPDAASRHIKPGTKVVIELTQYPEENQPAQGVITEVLGLAGEKDVDLRSIIVQHSLPGPFTEIVQDQARESLRQFDPETQRKQRVDMTDQVVCTIDPPDAKDYDDAISLRKLDNGRWELGVHIADVSFFVPEGSPLDEEARIRGNSAYFPGHVIPMLPEILSNGVCSLQEAVPRLCKSAFITYDESAQPVDAHFANTIINSRKRLRYIEAQAIIDGKDTIPHPDGDRSVDDYPAEVIELLHQMNALAKRLQKRRGAQGQIVLELPEVDLVLDEEGKVIDAVEEDQSFTHTLIEMFMVEANEAVARLLNSTGVPFLRRVHPEPDLGDSERFRQFVSVAGFKLPKVLDRKAIQALLQQVRGRPESYAINLSVLKSLTRAEYSPEPVGHYALASEQYCHFTSPIRRYADLTIHRLLDRYFAVTDQASPGARKRKQIKEAMLDQSPKNDDTVKLGRHLSYTERRADDAERELRKIKLLELLEKHIGDIYPGVVTGITNFGIFVQLSHYLIEGVIRYEDLMDDWWDVDERGGFIRGQRTGTRIRIGDVAQVYIVRVDVARRELELAIAKLQGRDALPQPAPGTVKKKGPPKGRVKGKGPNKPASHARGGETRTARQPTKQKGRGRR